MYIKLMDSTIRDGGNVNDWNFGIRTIDGIVKNLVDSGIDIIELGYLKNGSYDINHTLYNRVSEAERNLPDNKKNAEFSLMVQVDKWDWDKLEDCDGKIRHIRVSFHKIRVKEGLELCRKVINKGYICHCNPINIMGYNDRELLDLIEACNDVEPYCFTIVDTFGSMTLGDMRRINALIENNLNKKILVSAHLHENLGLAFSLAQEFVEFYSTRREAFIDASLNGMGRVPGNLCQELIMNYLIQNRKADYNIDAIYDAIDDFISAIKAKYSWGYAVPYALSASYNLHRTYSEYLMQKGKLRTKDIKAILSTVSPDKKVIYDQNYIEELYQNYMSVDIDDFNYRKRLSEEVKGKNILILASGKKIVDETEKIKNMIERENCVIISINFVCDFIRSDYVFYTNYRRYVYENKLKNTCKQIISSNLIKNNVNAEYVFGYSYLTKFGNKKCEDSVLMALKLFTELGVNKIYIAGFDGFIGREDHFDKGLDNFLISKGHSKNVREILEVFFHDVKLNFVTSSYYE